MLGMKVIYPLAPAISARMAWDTVLPSAEWQAELAGNISVVQNHPALLGYMVCDDCCSSREQTSLTAQLYDRLKQLDPYHLIMGAVQCNNVQPSQSTQLQDVHDCLWCIHQCARLMISERLLVIAGMDVFGR